MARIKNLFIVERWCPVGWRRRRRWRYHRDGADGWSKQACLSWKNGLAFGSVGRKFQRRRQYGNLNFFFRWEPRMFIFVRFTMQWQYVHYLILIKLGIQTEKFIRKCCTPLGFEPGWGLPMYEILWAKELHLVGSNPNGVQHFCINFSVCMPSLN